MVGKQHNNLLWRRNTYREWQQEKAAFPTCNIKENIVITRKPTQKEWKVGFATVFADITSRGALPEESSIYTAEINNKNSNETYTKKRG